MIGQTNEKTAFQKALTRAEDLIHIAWSVSKENDTTPEKELIGLIDSSDYYISDLAKELATRLIRCPAFI